MIPSVKKVGIWGFGIVGKAAASYFHAHGYAVEVIDRRALNPDEQALLAARKIPWYSQDDIEPFLMRNDLILPSAGIDISNYFARYEDKWIFELDLFYRLFPHPIIAISGSVGKTTVTHLLSYILTQYGLTIATGGNIGIGLLDLVAQQDQVDYAVIEVSSFQLERCTQFAPQLALWTNLHPNHLDRHPSLESYFEAKYPLIKQQQNAQLTLLPLELLPAVRARTARSLNFFIAREPVDRQIAMLHHDDTLFYLANGHAMIYQDRTHRPLFFLDQLPPVTFASNWLMIVAAVQLLKLPLETLPMYAAQATIPPHRVELVATVNGIIFYNDSKGTTPSSTAAAIDRFAGKSILLFLGGLSKGVDRAPFISSLVNKVDTIFCFGAEADKLQQMGKNVGIRSFASATLDDAFALCIAHLKQDQVVLFSPSGSSYDLFNDYQERGNQFKKLVLDYQRKLVKNENGVFKEKNAKNLFNKLRI